MKNLTASNNTVTFFNAIILHWDPIPEPEPINRRTLFPEAFVRNVTYQVNITDNFGILVNSSKTNRTIIVIDVDITPCNYYNVSVTSVINFELRYSGLEARIGRIYPYEGMRVILVMLEYKMKMTLVCIDFPSIISASVHNSTVVELYEIQYVFLLSVCSDTTATTLANTSTDYMHGYKFKWNEYGY